MTSNNRCDIVIEICCNNDVLGTFFNPIAGEGDEPYFYQWLSEGDENDRDWRDVCDRMIVYYADVEEWICWGIDCDDGEVMGIDLDETIEEWGDTDEIPF